MHKSRRSTSGSIRWRRRRSFNTDTVALASAPAVNTYRYPAYTKLDRELLVPDPQLRARVLPLVGQPTLGCAPGAILVDGEIVGAWQRHQRKVTNHPWSTPSPAIHDATESEALAFPIAGSSKPSVAWVEVVFEFTPAQMHQPGSSA